MHATNPSTASPEPRLTIQGQLDDLALVWPWVEALAAEYSVPAETRYAIQLCLEESLSNVIRHGYRGHADQTITIACTIECAASGDSELVFAIDDQAPPFDPFTPIREAQTAATLAELEPGGRGILLMRKFASRVAWEQLPNGNRLILGFTLTR